MHQKEAEEQLETLTALAKESQQPFAPASVIVGRALVHLGKGEPVAAEPLLRDGISQLRGPGSLRPRLRTSLFLARSLTMAKRFEDAERLLMDLERRTRNSRTFFLIDQYHVARSMVRLYEAWEKPAQAQRWQQRSAELISLR
jgi:hypothetical protein